MPHTGKIRLNQQNPHKSDLFDFNAGLAAIVLALLCYAGVANAVGLGRINVLSRMGQPFAAEIDLINASRDDLATLRVNQAPPAAYEAANLRFDPALNALRLSVERRANGTPYIRATSLRPVNEPYLDVVVELTAQEIRLRRAYAALLDLPDSPAPATAVAERAAPAPAPRAEAALPRAPAVARAPRPPADSMRAIAPARPAPAPAVPAARPPQTPAAQSKPVAVAAAPKAAEPVRSEPAAATPAAPHKPVAVAAAPNAAESVRPEPATTTPAPAATEQRTEGSSNAEQPVAATGESAAVSAAAVPPPAPKNAPAPLLPPQSGGGGFLSNYALPLGGVGLALLAGIGGLWAWRRRKPLEAAVAVPVVREAAPQAPVFGTTAGAVASPVVTHAAPPVAVAAQSEVPFEPRVASVTASVDALDEAIVHLRYGQSERAEEILRDALSKQPGREDIQMQLLEILAGRGDREGFNQMAGRMHKQTGGLGDHWKRVMAMGYALDPGYPLYSPTDEVAAHLTPVAAPDIDLDKTMVLTRTVTAATPLPDDTGAADLRLDADIPGIDMEKTMVLPRAGAGPAPAREPLPDFQFELPVAGNPALEAAAHTVTTTPAASGHPGLDFHVDLPGIDLKLADATNDVSAPAEASPQWEENQKKLLLARAYREMGDKEGALELLREVERDGDSAQLAEVREIMQTLA